MSNFGHLQPVATSRLRAEAATAGLGATPTNALRASRDTATYNAAIAPPRPGEAPSEAEARLRAAGLQLLPVDGGDSWTADSEVCIEDNTGTLHGPLQRAACAAASSVLRGMLEDAEPGALTLPFGSDLDIGPPEMAHLAAYIVSVGTRGAPPLAAAFSTALCRAADAGGFFGLLVCLVDALGASLVAQAEQGLLPVAVDAELEDLLDPAARGLLRLLGAAPLAIIAAHAPEPAAGWAAAELGRRGLAGLAEAAAHGLFELPQAGGPSPRHAAPRSASTARAPPPC